MESTDHLFVHCFFTVRICELTKDWLGFQGICPRDCANLNIKEWWSLLADGATPQKKALASSHLAHRVETLEQMQRKILPQ
jgi:hypothetical protein